MYLTGTKFECYECGEIHRLVRLGDDDPAYICQDCLAKALQMLKDAEGEKEC